MSRVPRQHALDMVNADVKMGDEFDRRWSDDPTLTVGERLRAMDSLAVMIVEDFTKREES